MILAELADKLPGVRRDMLLSFIFLAIYCVLDIFGLALSFPPDYVSAINPSNGLLLAAMILTPPRKWWMIAAAAIPAKFISNFQSNVEWHRVIAILGAQFFQAAFLCHLLDLLKVNPPRFEKASSLASFYVASLLAPLLGAFPGALASTYGNSSPFWTIWRDWFVGDLLTYIVVAPLIIMLLSSDLTPGKKERSFGFLFEAAAFTVGYLMVLSYWQNPTAVMKSVVPAMLYLPLPFMAWSAVRFGPLGTFMTVLVFALTSIETASAGSGVFATGVPQENILSLQLFLILSITPVVFLAVSVKNVVTAAESEKKLMERFQSLFEDVPIGLWLEDLSSVKRVVDDLKASGVTDLEEYLLKHPEETVRLAMGVRITDVNRATLRMTSARTKEQLIIGSHLIFGPESLDGLRKMVVGLDNNSVSARCEGINRTLDGKKIWVDVHAHAMPGNEDDWSQVIISTTDLTDRKTAERALQESDNRHRDILRAMTDGLVITDMEGTVESWNRAASEMYGYGHGEMAGMDFRNLLSEGDRDRWNELKTVVISSRTYAGESEDIRKDGSLFHTELRATRIFFGEKPHILLLVRDITDRKNSEAVQLSLEEQLRRAQKLEAIGTLAGGVAHDFNNILAAMMGYAELTLLKVPSGSPQHEYVMRILKAGERAKSVVQQILSFSRQTELEKKPLDLRPVFHETIRLLRATIPTTIAIKTNFTEEPVVVLADSTRMHQVLMNLATNAYHAMHHTGGQLTISLGLSRDEPGFVMLTVKDTGHGITQDILERIFDPYFTTKEVGQGSGMGLAVVQGIVAEHGGRIEVESRPGGGTVFKILLPYYDKGPPVKQTAESPYVGRLWGNETVLMVDDEPAITELTEIALKQYGYNVRVYNSPKLALADFVSDPAKVDVVISDQTMPEMTGTELAKKMLAIKPDLPIIICTGHSDSINMENAHKQGIGTFFMKPVKTVELAQAIRRLSGG